MVIIPLGLVSKTKNFPFATVVLSVVTVFYSIVHFSIIESGKDTFWYSKNRQRYAKEAKNYVVTKCAQDQAKVFCEGLDEFSFKVFLMPEKVRTFIDSKDPSVALMDFVAEELSPEKLKVNNPNLYQIFLLSEKDKIQFAKDNQLLAHSNLNWVSAFRTLFLHSGYAHLLGNLLILIFLAFPVEERMGSLLFATTYLVTGMIGSTIHVLAVPEAFYLIGASSAVSGVAGALTYFFWRNHARVLVSFFFIFTQTLIIPVFIYTPVFMLANDFVGTLNPLTNTAHLAHLGGFVAGVGMAFLFNLLLPMPYYFTYPFEYDFFEKSKKNLSQFDRIKVFAEWLYYTPMNLHAFKALVKEVERSDINPKVEKLLKHFRNHSFSDIYHLNRKNIDFIKMLPVHWLAWVPVGEDPVFLKKMAKKFEDERDFQSAFKMNFLTLNEIGWRDDEWSLQLFKNYKKSSINKKFMKDIEKLKQGHSPFKRFIEQRAGFDVYSA